MDGSGWEGGEWVSKVGIYEAIYDIFFHVWVFFRNGGPSPIFLATCLCIGCVKTCPALQVWIKEVDTFVEHTGQFMTIKTPDYDPL